MKAVSQNVPTSPTQVVHGSDERSFLSLYKFPSRITQLMLICFLVICQVLFILIYHLCFKLIHSVLVVS